MINGLDNTYLDITNVVNLNNIQDLKCQTIETTLVEADRFNQLRDINTNTTIQEQINSLYFNGGCFPILATQNSGFVANTYWGFSSGSNPTVNNPLIFGFKFLLRSITIVCQTIPSQTATVRIYKNTTVIYEMTINTLINTFNNIDISYEIGETFNIFTLSGSGGTMVRATISCQVGAVQGLKGDAGDTPQLTIGSVTQTNSPTVTITGTSTNPILNFGLPSQPNFTIGTVINGSSPNVTITGSQSAPILNYTLQKGDTGSQGPQGPQGDKGDKGDTGSISAVTQAQIDANTAGLVSLGLTVTALEADVATLDASVAGLTTDITTINEEIDALQGKTQYITTNVSTITTNFASKITATNDILTAGKLSASSDITTTANISGNQISATTGNIDAITTSSTQTQNIYGSTVNIGTTGINNVNIGSATSSIYINGIPYLPFSNSTSYFNQWS